MMKKAVVRALLKHIETRHGTSAWKAFKEAK